MSRASDVSVCSSHSLNGINSFNLAAHRPIAQYKASLWTTEARSMDARATFRLLLRDDLHLTRLNRSTHEPFLWTSSTRRAPRIQNIGYIFALATVPHKPKVEHKLRIYEKMIEHTRISYSHWSFSLSSKFTHSSGSAIQFSKSDGFNDMKRVISKRTAFSTKSWESTWKNQMQTKRRRFYTYYSYWAFHFFLMASTAKDFL